MSTQVQLEAMQILQERENGIKCYDTAMKVASIGAHLIVPGGGFVMSGMALIGKATVSFIDREYVAELRKAARGERDTLPEPPPQEDGGWCCAS